MNLLNQSVTNNVYGQGTVTAQDKNYIYVSFEVGEKKFKYPEAFDGFLKLKDEVMQELVNAHMTQLKLKTQVIKKQEENEKQEKLEKTKRNSKSKSNVSTCVNIAFKFEEYNYEALDMDKLKIGLVKTGKNKDKPIKLSRIQNGGLCVLTTNNPEMPESERCVFGAFLIDGCNKTKNSDEGFLFANPNYKIKLSEDESKQIKFWGEEIPQKITWSSGLHRYFENEDAIKLLQQIVMIKKGTEEELLAENIYTHFCETI